MKQYLFFGLALFSLSLNVIGSDVPSTAEKNVQNRHDVSLLFTLKQVYPAVHDDLLSMVNKNGYVTTPNGVQVLKDFGLIEETGELTDRAIHLVNASLANKR